MESKDKVEKNLKLVLAQIQKRKIALEEKKQILEKKLLDLKNQELKTLKDIYVLTGICRHTYCYRNRSGGVFCSVCDRYEETDS